MAQSTAYEKHPEHIIEIDEELKAVRVTLDGRVLAETNHGLNLREGKYPAVVYVPRADVRMDDLRRTDETTHCPFKGDAHYFANPIQINQDAATAKPIAWSYETPFDQMVAIREYLAFYSDRVEIEDLT